VVSFNKIVSSNTLKTRLVDCVPTELMEPIEPTNEEYNGKEPKRYKGIHKMLHIK
jgi:hypothetical protein